MNKSKFILPSVALLGTFLVYQWSKEPSDLITSPSQSPLVSRQTSSFSSHQLTERSLAAKGMLWETVEANGRERLSKSMPISSHSFAEARSSDIGTNLNMRLSDQMPALQATVAGRNTESDGTVITHLRIAGTPEGQLTIQENAAMDFFIAQLYFDNLPIAYEFKKSADALVATRHTLSAMLCSVVDQQAAEVVQMGLPPMDYARSMQSVDMDIAEITKAQLSKSVVKPTTTYPTLSVVDVSTTEGNSGSKLLTFTVKLSKKNSKTATSVNYTTADGSALAGSDYTAASGLVTVPKGKITATFSVSITGDTTVESDESFFANFSNPVNALMSDRQAVGLITTDDSPPSSVPVFNSLPGAEAVIYLDMDGQVVSGTQWASGATITARGLVGTLTNAQLLEICRRTAEDFSPFQLNVTTEESVYLAAPSARRIRCIITPDNEWYGPTGGVAYVSSFTWAGDTPCWVFSDMMSNNPRHIASASSHEIGHTLSLNHDGRVSPAEGYYQGHGSGEVGWAPIMGLSYYKLLVQWSKGEYLSANNLEDDLTRITTLNGFSYRADQVSNTIAGATPLSGSAGARNANGILEMTGDQDVFSFSTAGGSSSFSALGDANSQNVDLLLEILDQSGAVIASGNPDTLTDASVTATLAAGDYYVRVSGVGRGDVLVDGYSNYSSIGQYSITGNAP